MLRRNFVAWFAALPVVGLLAKGSAAKEQEFQRVDWDMLLSKNAKTNLRERGRALHLTDDEWDTDPCPRIVKYELYVSGGPMDGRVIRMVPGVSAFWCRYRTRDSEGNRVERATFYKIHSILRRPIKMYKGKRTIRSIALESTYNQMYGYE